MSPIEWSGVGVAFGLAVLLLISRWPSARRRYSAGWIRDQGVPVTAELVREVEVDRWNQFVAGTAGLLVGLLFVLPVNLLFDSSDAESLARTTAVWVAPFVLALVGRGVPGLVYAFREVGGSIRVAKSWAPRLTDYVSPIGLLVMRVELALILMAGLAATQVPRWTGVGFDPRQLAYVWGAVVLVAVMWAGVELLAHRLVAQPLPSVDATSLFWRDALRGERLRDMCRTLPWFGYLTPMVIAMSLPRFYGTPAAGTGPDVVFRVSTTILVLALVAQLLLLRSPKKRREDAVLVAARRPLQDV